MENRRIILHNGIEYLKPIAFDDQRIIEKVWFKENDRFYSGAIIETFFGNRKRLLVNSNYIVETY